MSLLVRYLFKQNVFLVFTILMAGSGLYILTDLFERLDDFLEAGVSVGFVLSYFVMKLPMIISQILPAVFLLAFVIQLNILDRTRELTALEAGGISPFVILRFILLYGLLWALGQFFFSQVLGVAGDRWATAVWQEEVRGEDPETISLRNRWITDNTEGAWRFIYFDRAFPKQKYGVGLQVYTIGGSGVEIQEILRAEKFTIERRQWVLHDVTRLSPERFSVEQLETFNLPIRQPLTDFQLLEKSGPKPSQTSPWNLSSTIRKLEDAGSNVESLRTALHGKYAYAAAIVVMGLMAVVVTRLTPNIYKAVGISLLMVFLFYSLNTFCITLGEKGITSPVVAAWFADTFFFLLCLVWLCLPAGRRKQWS